MSRADELAAKAARISAKKATQAAPAPTRKAAVLGTPVRVTVDLAPTQHRSLKDWNSKAAVTLGRARVTNQDVLKALVARLLSDSTLADQIITDLADSQ